MARVSKASQDSEEREDRHRATVIPDFGDRSAAVLALRSRVMYHRASLRLLSDMIDVLPEDSKGVIRDYFIVTHAETVSPCLFRSLEVPLTRAYRRIRNRQPTTRHFLWLCAAEDANASLEPLGELLVAAMAGQFGEKSAIVTLDEKGYCVRYWSDNGTFAAAGTHATLKELEDKTDAVHYCFVEPAPEASRRRPRSRKSNALPSAAADLVGRVHRIVQVTLAAPSQVSPGLTKLLVPEVCRRLVVSGDSHERWPQPGPRDPECGPFFSSFVASILGPQPAAEFETRRVDAEFDLPRGQRREVPGMRIQRDACRIHFDIERIEAMWQAWSEGGDGKDTKVAGRSFPEAVFRDLPAAKETAWRWARAVTNRSVGVALSGGGASSFRFVPMLEGLHAKGVPVDVLGGVSGGAFLGAYYCAKGLAGLKQAVKSGWKTQLAVAGSFGWAGVFRNWLNVDLGGARVEQCEVQFVPVATKLARGCPPEVHRVITGSMGRAVTVSGAAPVMFAPAFEISLEGIAHYSDGATAMLIPARVLKDCGADIVFAFNCMVGPSKPNPFSVLPGGELVYYLSPVGRFVDLFVSAAYLQQRLSREVGEDADVYFEPRAEPVPFFEALWFVNARAIAAAAKNEDVKRCVERCAARWSEIKKCRS